MPRPPSDAEQIALRVPKAWLAQADEIAKLISRPGFEASRTDAFRAAIAKGFELLFEELRPHSEAHDLDSAPARAPYPPPKKKR
jgi:hypothetical protein